MHIGGGKYAKNEDLFGGICTDKDNIRAAFGGTDVMQSDTNVENEEAECY